MPEAWFRLEGKIDYSDMLQATVALMEISRMQDREEWKEAYVRLEEAVSHSKELVGILKQEAEAELLFTALVIGAKRESYLMQGEVNMDLALMESLLSQC